MTNRTTFFAVSIAAVMGVAVFVIKYQVQDLEDHLSEIDRQIVAERQTIHVLKAEWSHLNETGRLRELAERYLNLSPLKHSQYLSTARFDEGLGDLKSADREVVAEGDVATFAERMKKALKIGTER